MHRHAQTCTLSCVCNSLYFIQYLISLPRTEKANARVSRTARQAQGTFHSATGLRPLPCSLVLSCIVMCSVVVCVCVLQIKSIESTAWCERTSQQHCDVEGFKWIRHRFGMQTKGSAEPQRQLVMAMQIGRGIFNPLNAKPNEVEEHFKSKQWKTSLRTLDL